MMDRLTRYPDWPERLARFVDARRAAPFAWGANDCCTFAGDAVAAITGRDLVGALGLRGLTTARSARRVLRQRSVADLASEVLGRPMHPRSMAQRGDVVLVEQQTVRGAQRLLGVCLGRQWAAPGGEGLVFGPMQGDTRRAVLGCWPIGHAEAGEGA